MSYIELLVYSDTRYRYRDWLWGWVAQAGWTLTPDSMMELYWMVRKSESESESSDSES